MSFTSSISNEDKESLLLSLEKREDKTNEDIAKIAELYLQLNDINKALENLLILDKADSNLEQIKFLIGNCFFKKGMLQDSLTWFNKCLKINPKNHVAHNLIGLIYVNENNFQMAKQYFETASSLEPMFVEPITNLGCIHLNNNNIIEAKNYFEKTLSLDPNNLLAKINCAICYLNSNKFSNAENLLKEIPNNNYVEEKFHAICRCYIAQNKTKEIENLLLEINQENHIDTRYNCLITIASLLKESSFKQLAIPFYEEAFKHNSKNLSIADSLMSIYASLNLNKSAIEWAEKCISISPNNYKAYQNLGALHSKEGDLNSAVISYELALSFNPNDTQITNELGKIYFFLFNLEKSLEYFNLTLYHKGYDQELLNNIAELYDFIGDYQNSMNFSLACATRPIQQYLEGNTEIFFTKEEADALAKYLLLSRFTCKWENIKQLTPLLKIIIDDQISDNLPLSLSAFSAPLMLQEIKYEALAAKSFGLKHSVEKNKRFNHKKESLSKNNFNIGFISPDFRRHSIGFLIQDIFKHHSEKFNIYCYYLGDKTDEYTDKIKLSCKKFISLHGIPIYEAAKAIFDDKIDVLIDLSGYTRMCQPKILSYQPAPIQASFLGHFGTMGVDFIQYHINSKELFNENEINFYTEKIVSLPNYPVVSNPFSEPKRIANRKEFGFPEDKFIMACLNKCYRITEELFSIWVEILNSSDDICLWIHPENKEGKDNILEYAKSKNVNLNKILFSETRFQISDDLHHTVADIYLDTYISSGGTTTLLSLYCNLPVIALETEYLHSKLTPVILKKLDMNELVFKEKEKYIKYIIELSKNKNMLTEMKRKLKDKVDKSDLFNPKNFIKDLEKSYLAMIDDYKKEGKQKIIDVN